MKKLLLCLCVMISGSLQAAEIKEDAAIAQLFAEAGFEGTFVLLDVQTGEMRGHNAVRANTRFIPASTFKIPNSLIALHTGAVSSVDEVLPYGGGETFLKQWARDMPLREAITMSNVPVYQGVARKIGLERMQKHVKLLGYGNQSIGSVVDRFWLDGPIMISAVEQARFLARLAKGELPVSAEAQAAVRDITLLEQGEGWALHGKTGYAIAADPDVGWWVGWVTRGDQIFTFAMNVEENGTFNTKERIVLGKDALGDMLNMTWID